MNRRDFAMRVAAGGEQFGAGSIIEDMIDAVERLLPLILELFENCPAARLQRLANRPRAIRTRLAKRQIAMVFDGEFDHSTSDVLADSVVSEAGCCSADTIESLRAA